MKKLLGILVLGLLWCNVGFANCRADVEFEWKIQKFGTEVLDYRDKFVNGAIHFRFNNPTQRTIEISWVALKTKDNVIMIEENHDLILEPFTQWNDIGLERGNLMTDLAGYGAYRCKYVSAGTTGKKKNKLKKNGLKKFLDKIFKK